MTRRAGDARKAGAVTPPRLEAEAAPSGQGAAAEPAAAAPSPIDALLTAPARHAAGERQAGSAVPGVVRATIVGVGDDGRPLVTWPGAREPVVAEPVWMSEPPPWSDCAGLAAAIGFEEGDSARPLLLGLLGTPPGRRDEDATASTDPPRSRRIEGGEELILQCGDAKIVLRADGTVTILGAKVVSRARGVNKIKGGSVQIN